MADQQTFEITAPNGKTLEVSGDHVPNEYELQEIFLKAGVATKDEPFAPTNVKEFLGRMGSAAVDMPIGMLKGAARIGQSVPGVSQATDWAFGLPKGASVKATEPSNLNQKVGTYLNDVAMIPALGAVDAGGPILSKAAGYISNPTAAEQAVNAARNVGSFAGDTMTALRAELTSGGMPAPEKVAGLILKFGKKAVATALIGSGLGAAWGAYKHLF